MPKGKVKNKTPRTGTPPTDGKLIATSPYGWQLWVYREEEKKGKQWVNAKLIATQTIPGKANYWLSYNTTKLDFGRTRDNMLLEIVDNELYLWAEQAIIRHYGRDETAGQDAVSIEDLL